MIDIPKNVRQIGYIDKAHRIYVEDYVISFAKNIAGTTNSRTAILLGKKFIENKEVWTFVNGLVLVDSFYPEKGTEFNGEIWSQIYDKIKLYYDDEEIVGWAYLDSYKGGAPGARLLHVHKTNFSGKNIVFLAYDTEDNEAVFYDFYDSAFVKRNGFYIYYQKNATMQAYMQSQLSSKNTETAADAIQDSVVTDIRDIIERKKKNKAIIKQPVYAAGMLVAAIGLLVGSVAVYRNNMPYKSSENDSAKEVFSSDYVENTSTPAAEATDAPANDVIDFDDNNKDDIVTPAPEITAEPDNNDILEATQVDEQPTDDTKVVSGNTNYSFYIVKAGDSLSVISEKLFSSIKYVDEIKALNNIDNEDMIFEGQKLWIPDK